MTESTPGGPAHGEDAADVAAIEQITGRVLAGPWPPDAFAPGTRVRVIRDPGWDGPWAREFLGTISDMAPPQPVAHRQAQPNELAYWVAFDVPQHDSNGDGPYRKALIWSRYLIPAMEQSGQ